MTVILAIESSCDETGVGIAELGADGSVTLLADEVASSVDEHARFGGVVPEIASRAHLEALGPTMRRALETAGIDRPDVVAATIGPGLAGALLVGVAAAKAYSAAWRCRSTRSTISAGTWPPMSTTTARCRMHRSAGLGRAHQPAARALAGRTDR